MPPSIRRYWDQLVRPLRNTDDEEVVRRSRFMASFMLVASGFIPPALVVFSALDWSLARGLGIYGAAFCLVIAYLLARMACPTESSLVLVFGCSLVLFVQAVLFQSEDSVHLLFYFAFLTAFSGAFISTVATLALGFVHAVMGLALPFLVTPFTVRDLLEGPVFFNIVSVVFTLMIAHYTRSRRIAQTERLEASEYSYRLLAIEHEMQARWLEDILSASPDHIIVFDRSGRLLYANESVAQAFRRERGDLIHKTGEEIGLPAEMTAPLHGFIERIFNGEERITTEISTAPPYHDGESQYFAFTVSPIRDAYGKVLAAVATRRDITAQVRIQHELEASRERYRIVSESTSDYAFAFSLPENPEEEGQVEWITDSFKRVTGYEWEELTATGDIFYLYHPDDRDIARKDAARAEAGETLTAEYRIVTREGAERWVRIHRRPEQDPANGQVRRYYGVVQDITERRQAEHQRIKLAAEREHMHIVQQFVLAVSHDFRNSLANIETSRYLLHRRLIEPGDDPQMLAKSETIRSNVAHLSEQLDNLSTVFSLREPADGQVNVAAMVGALVQQGRALATMKSITLESDIASYLPGVSGSTGELAQAVRHILNNALAYTPEGGRIRLTVGHANDEVVISVSDNGPGIAPEHLPNIFDLFYRADPARPMTAGGVGVGLSIVKLIVDGHGGHVEVESEQGVGSTFTIYLPASTSASSSQDTTLHDTGQDAVR